MRNIKKEKMKKNSEEKIKNFLLKALLGKETLYMMKHGGSAHFQQNLVLNKKIRITTIDGKMFEGVVVDYHYPDWSKSEEDEIIVLEDSSAASVQFKISNIRSAEIIQ